MTVSCPRAGQGGHTETVSEGIEVPIPTSLSFLLAQKFAQTIFFPLIKVCFNQIQYQWPSRQTPGGTRGSGNQRQAATPVVRLSEAEALLSALRSAGTAGPSTSGRVVGAVGTGGAPSSGRSSGGRTGATSGYGTGSSSLLSMAPESINWQQHAIMAYRDMVTAGHKPGVEVLDMLLGCMRLPKQAAMEAAATRGEADLEGDGVDGLLGTTGGHHHSPPGSHLAGAEFGAGMMMGRLAGFGGGSPTGNMMGGRPGASMSGAVTRQPWEQPSGATSSSPSSSPAAEADQRYRSGFDKRWVSTRVYTIYAGACL